MRFVILTLVALCSLPSLAQERVFRASSIDVEQDQRLDSLESRVSALESVPTSAPPKPAPLTKQLSTANLVAKPTKPAKPYAVITIESLPGCPPCERWKSKEASELRAQGWTVVEAPLTSSNSAPFFRICIGDKCYSHRGFMSHGALRGIVGNARGVVQNARQEIKQPARSARYTTSELRSMIQSKRPGGWTGPVYADVSPRSAAKQHLVGREHGFSWDQVSGLTQEEALILHDLAPRHGNQIFPTR